MNIKLRKKLINPIRDSIKIIGKCILVCLAIIPISVHEIEKRLWQTCDDNSYAFIAKKLWVEGSLSDPYNIRRSITSPFTSVIQSVAIGPFSPNLLHSTDLIFGILFVFVVLLCISFTAALFICVFPQMLVSADLTQRQLI